MIVYVLIDQYLALISFICARSW